MEEQSNQVASKTGRFTNLDVFRGICAFQVFVYHLYAHVRYELVFPEGSLALRVYLAVWYVLQALSTFSVLGFFVLSGLVITLYVRRDIAPEGKLECTLFDRTGGGLH